MTELAAKRNFLTLQPDRAKTRLCLKLMTKHGELLYKAGQSYNNLWSQEPLALDCIQTGWLRARLRDFKQKRRSLG